MYGPSRYVCSVLDEMRECMKHLNFALLPSLIEEAQTLFNRMESSISDAGSLPEINEKLDDYKDKRKKLRKEIADLKEEKRKLSQELNRG